MRKHLPLLLTLVCAAACPVAAQAMSQPLAEIFMVANRCPHPVEIRIKQSRKTPWGRILPRGDGAGKEYEQLDKETLTGLGSNENLYLSAQMWGLFRFHHNRAPRVSFYYQNRKVPSEKGWQAEDMSVFRQQHPFLSGLFDVNSAVFACAENMTEQDRAVWKK